MRVNDLSGTWRLTGDEPWETGGRIGPVPCRVPGYALYALQEAGIIPVPAVPGDMAACEWISRRIWTYECAYACPEEPYEGRSEKYYLHLRAAGHGYASVDGERVGTLEGPWREGVFDVTRYMERDGSRVISVTLDRPMDGEGPVPMAGILHASVRSVAFCRVGQARAVGDADGIAVTVRVHGFASGNVRCRYRVLLGDALVASHDEQEKLIADEQTYEHKIPVPDMKAWRLGGGAVYTVRLTIERGGTRCDQAVMNAAYRMVSFVPIPSAPGAHPYALRDVDARVFIQGVNVLPPVTVSELESFARAGANLIRFHGPMPPDEDALEALDRLGIALWQELPEDAQGARDMATRLANHPCALAISAGHAVAGPDGAPAGPTHPGVHAVREAAMGAHPGAVFFPSSPSGPVALLNGIYEGRGLSHDVHGPLALQEDTFGRLDASDALLLSKAGFPAPMPLPRAPGDSAVYGGYAKWLEKLCGPPPDMLTMLRIGRFVQAQALQYVVLSARRRDTTGCAGLIVWCGNAPGIPAVSHALLDAGGRERPALYALRRAWTHTAVSARMEKDAYLRGETLQADIYPHIPRGESGVLAVGAKICDLRGVALAEELWQIPARDGAAACGRLRMLLPAETPDILLLCLWAERAGEAIFRDVMAVPVPYEGEPRLAPLARLPQGRPAITVRDGAAEMVNDGPDALLGVAVYAGREILFQGVLLPWERVPIEIPDGFLTDSLLTEALNPVPDAQGAR